MKVLHLVKTSVGATWALRQMRELVGLGVEVHVAMPRGPLLPDYLAAGVVVHEGQFALPMNRPHRWGGLFDSFRSLIADVRPSIIHSHFVGTTLTMRMAMGKSHPIPRLFQVPGPLHLEHLAFRRGEIATAGPLDHWVGSCRWTVDRYRQSGAPDDRVHLAYYGLDLEEVLMKPRGALRSELQLDPEAPIIGMVAFMYPPKRFLGQRRGIKGHEDLVDAAALLRQDHPNLQTVFVGSAWGGASAYEQHLHTYAWQRLGDSVHFLGTRRDVPQLYADFDVAVHPSHSENVGGAAESLLLGIPTVATNVGGFPDVVVPGETGCLVPPKDPPALAEAIAFMLDNMQSAHTLAENGQRRTRKMFDVGSTASDVCRIYERILHQ